MDRLSGFSSIEIPSLLGDPCSGTPHGRGLSELICLFPGYHCPLDATATSLPACSHGGLTRCLLYILYIYSCTTWEDAKIEEERKRRSSSWTTHERQIGLHEKIWAEDGRRGGAVLKIIRSHKKFSWLWHHVLKVHVEKRNTFEGLRERARDKRLGRVWSVNWTHRVDLQGNWDGSEGGE